MSSGGSGGIQRIVMWGSHMQTAETINDAVGIYGSPGVCSNCELYNEGLCVRAHRIQCIIIHQGILPEIYVRRLYGVEREVRK